MPDSVLFVDDEQNLLDGITRALRNRFDVHTATSGSEGLRMLQSGGPFAVVVSDMRMPDMNGVQFLSQARALCPDTVRFILSGQSDMADTIAAVNDGNIFRFLSKPCSTQALMAAVGTGVEQYQLITAERVLLEQTLSGAVAVLVEILNAVTPAAYAQTCRLQKYVLALVATLGLRERWQWPLAALLSQIGCIALPKNTLSKVQAGELLDEEEKTLYESHPRVAGKMLQAIPRLEDVAAIVGSQNEPLSGLEVPEDTRQWPVREAGIVLLRAASEFDRQVITGRDASVAAEAIATADTRLPRLIINALSQMPIAGKRRIMKMVHLVELAPGMLLDEALVTCKGACLVPAGQEMTPPLLLRLRSIAAGVQVKEPFRVQVSV